MFLNYVDVVSLTTSPPQGVVKQLDSQLISIKRQVSISSPGCVSAAPPDRPADHLCSVHQIQSIKQSNSLLKEKISSGVDEFRQPEVTNATSRQP